MVRYAVNDHDVPAAESALQTMLNHWPEDEETLDALALVEIAAEAYGGGSGRYAGAMFVSTEPASANAEVEPLEGFRLLPAYPNPFNPATVVPFEVSAPSHVNIEVYDVLGRCVAQLVDGTFDAGFHTASFDGSNLASGMYLLKAEITGENTAGVATFTQQITLLK